MKNSIAILLIILSFNTFAKGDSTRSYFDVQERMKLIEGHENNFKDYLPRKIKSDTSSFPIPINGTISIPYFYQDKEGYQEKSKPLVELESYISNLAASYVAFQNKRDLTCMIEGLKLWGKAGALLSFNKGQAWVNVGWTATSIALNYSIAKSQGFKSRFIEDWLIKITEEVLS
jgi:hypothetical protein